MNVDRRRVGWFLVATLVLATLVYVSDYREFADVLLRSDPWYVALAVGCGCFTLLMWAAVWHRFFGLFGVEARFRESVRLLLAGTFLNAVTPLGRFGGEPVAAHLVVQQTGASPQRALSSVSSADLSNAFPFLTFGTAAAAYLAFTGGLTGLLADVAAAVVALLVVSLVVMYLLWFGGLRSLGGRLGRYVTIERGLGRIGRLLRWLQARVREVLVELREVGRNPRHAAGTLVVSHLAVAGHVGATYAVLLAVDVEPAVAPTLLVVTLSAVLTVSPTPGSAGTFEAGFALLVALFFPVTAATAATVAVLYRVGTYLPGIVLGYASLLSLRVGDDAGG